MICVPASSGLIRFRWQWCLSVFLASVTVFLGGCTKTVRVPDVVGLSEAEATEAITGAKLTVGAVTKETSTTVPAGKVISQDPKSGSSVAQGSAVNLVLSSGPPPVPVPDVVGMTQAEATAAITGAKLTVGTVTQDTSSTVPSGKVISQDPKSGSSVAQGSAVNLVLSLPPPPSNDPDAELHTHAEVTSAIT